MRYLITIFNIVITLQAVCQDIEHENMKGEKWTERFYPIIREYSLDSIKLPFSDTNSIQIIPLIDQNPIREWYRTSSHYNDGSSKYIIKERLQDDYLIYVINISETDIEINTYNKSGFFFQQEAKNKKGEWRAIENESESGCRLVYRPYSIKSNKAYSTFAKKYTGSFETVVRLKLLISSQTEPKYIYSKPFIMKIDPLRLEKDFR